MLFYIDSCQPRPTWNTSVNVSANFTFLLSFLSCFTIYNRRTSGKCRKEIKRVRSKWLEKKKERKKHGIGEEWTERRKRSVVEAIFVSKALTKRATSPLHSLIIRVDTFFPFPRRIFQPAGRTNVFPKFTRVQRFALTPLKSAKISPRRKE